MDLIRNFLGGGNNGEEPDAKRVKREDDDSAGAANGGANGTSTSGAGEASRASPRLHVSDAKLRMPPTYLLRGG